MMKNSNDLVAQSDAFDKKLEENPDLNKSIADLFKYGQRSRQLIRWVIASVVIEALLIAGVGFVFVKSNSTRNAVVTSCNNGNEFRKDNLKLWNYILAFPSPQPQTPEQQKNVADFKVFVHQTFALRDCSSLK